MTKFCGDAVASRGGRKNSLYTKKDLEKNMQQFLETGVHPDLQKAQQERASRVPPLPDHDATRPFVFLEISVGNRPAGRLVVELFQDLAPAAALHLRNRCLPGAAASLVGLQFTKLLRNYCLSGCRSAAAAVPAGGRVARHHRLQHASSGAVSISLDGAEVGLAFAPAPNMDATHQVVGRVHLGQELLQELADLATGPDDRPLVAVKVAGAGPTNARGDVNTLAGGGAPSETPEQTAARLQQESQDMKSAVLEALQEGMADRKRKAPDAGAAGSPQPAAKAAATAAAAAAAAAAGTSHAGASEAGDSKPPPTAAAAAAAAEAAGRKAPGGRRILDSLLDEISDDSSADED